MFGHQDQFKSKFLPYVICKNFFYLFQYLNIFSFEFFFTSSRWGCWILDSPPPRPPVTTSTTTTAATTTAIPLLLQVLPQPQVLLQLLLWFPHTSLPLPGQASQDLATSVLQLKHMILNASHCCSAEWFPSFAFQSGIEILVLNLASRGWGSLDANILLVSF